MTDDYRSEDLGEITAHRAFVPGLVWAGALAAACGGSSGRARRLNPT